MLLMNVDISLLEVVSTSEGRLLVDSATEELRLLVLDLDELLV